jgi:aryl-alcohol dehydrogenase-like predicted oxidoreductase
MAATPFWGADAEEPDLDTRRNHQSRAWPRTGRDGHSVLGGKMIDAQRVVDTRPPTQVALAWLLAQGEKCLRQAGAVAICGFRPPRIWWMLRARTLDRQHGGSHG